MEPQGATTEERRDWIVVTALGCTEAISYGVLYYAFAVFVKLMQMELGWSRSALTGAFSLALLLSGIVGLLVGRWLDLHGPHLLMTVGSIGAAALVVAWSQTRNLVAFYGIWLGIGLVMAAVLYEPAFWIVAARFDRRRGRALTLLTFLAGFASVIFVPLAGALTLALGWRTALVILAGILAVGTIPIHALALRSRRSARPRVLSATPEPQPLEGVRATGGDSARQRVARLDLLWWLSAAFFLITLSSAALATHLVPLLTERGFSPLVAASTVGVFGLAALPGRLIFTPLGDRFPRANVNVLLFGMHGLGLLALLFVPGLPGVAVFVALFGSAFGAVTPARAGMVADLFGSERYGQINGVVALAMTVARSVAPFGVSLLYDATHGYGVALYALLASTLLGLFALFRVDALAQNPRLRTTGSTDANA